jgi:hypothetical protein
MLMRLFFIVLIFNTFCVSAQKSITISGTITDFQNGEHLVGVAVYDSISNKGTLSNSYGFYSLSLKSGSINLRYSSLGYKSEGLSRNFKKDTVVYLTLKPAITELGEVIVTGTSSYKPVLFR